ncbi:centrosomal protein of 95 kDa isoform X1 [Hyla sarda]|uniref:centrosomal protein of 95 kDa isoform X1 n=1 Tax=Hyla sarda TaxID=327740 RepID=UPI0024C314F8|nr:centrosomal protein of 95 kDa isoform X1 [Hyla sarda]XP_056405776.1 centrosomal protein of 95 kDa isoform X1 [Hyla sarda]XP_056405777.1 centrosomal protein of 95 kDa isoform X1 [Hyla sarda]XP_056405778.1 centrosomal protein of 95 kDa isoform X1 [Hyla sarda]XP_056405779.1 centrosomal protein of 95 kDa isoform X1 [Hyla sarda]XP_056405780.1 centrosomal protein of 95 kDa isoform X1 [Hyla sarda]
MGAQETDWVTIANNLRSRCHVTLPLSDLTHCDARFFVSIYEAILGEKVPDFITDSQTPEDDAHNVQSVIDSLALDYLQVSLSHITGENVVRGDTESIRNLLEIFDGLLEYLTEQISEASSQNGDLECKDRRGSHDVPPSLKPPPSIGSLSSDLHPPSWVVEGSESTAELIRLGDTAHTFALRGLDVERTPQPMMQPRTPTGEGHFLMNGSPSRERDNIYEDEVLAAIPLNPPYQPTMSLLHGVNRDVQVSLGSSGSSLRSPVKSKALPDGGEVLAGPRATNGDVAHEVCPVERPLKSAERKGPKEGSQEVHLGQKRVAFCTQPDIRLMTLQSSLRDWNDGAETSAQREDTEETLLTTLEPLSLVEEPLSVQRARNRLSELELQEMSEKLSRRLDELDRMLKAALGGPMRSSDQEDKLSQHSDSIMEIRRKKRLHATGRTRPPTARPRSLSSSPPPPRSLSAQFEDALNKEARGEMGKIRRNVQKELEVERLKAQLLRNAYAQELKDFEETERQKLVKLKEGLREEEQEYKENIFKEPPKKSHPEKVYAGKRAPSKPKHWAPNLHKSENRMKIKENDLLPLLLEEFPHLQISQQTLNAMWRGQMAQVEQLARSGQDTERSERHLQNEVEEARKKHNLLVSLIQKEQEHNQRLKDFKDRIRLQKSAQNRMRENRSQAARAKKYYDDYHVQLRAKLMRARTREEKIFKNLFEEGLEVQKERLREIRSYAKEQREEQRRRHRDELESMENYYKDQFAMLAEAVSQEKQEIHTREKSQAKTLHKIKRDLRGKMEKEIEALQQLILRTDEDAFFRELEAERLRRRVQMASFQYSKSHCL